MPEGVLRLVMLDSSSHNTSWLDKEMMPEGVLRLEIDHQVVQRQHVLKRR